MVIQFGGNPTHSQIDLATTCAERLKESIKAMQLQANMVCEGCEAMIASDLSTTSSVVLLDSLKMSSELLILQDEVLDALNRIKVIKEFLARRNELASHQFDETQIAGMVVTEAEARFGSNDPRLAVAYQMIALFCQDMTWYRLASQWMAKAVETQRGAVRVKPELKSRQADLERYLMQLASMYAREQDYCKAADIVEEALYHQNAIYGPNHERTEYASWVLGQYREKASKEETSSACVFGDAEVGRFATAHFPGLTNGQDIVATALQQVYQNRY